MSSQLRAVIFGLFVLASAVPARAVAQGSSPVPVHAELFAGGEFEEYLRTLQVTGRVPLYPWSIRGFSRLELGRLAPVDSVHPWVGRYDLAPDGGARGITLVQPQGELVLNSNFPYGINNGPTWTGRGLTASARFGFRGHWGPVSVSLVPEAFIAQNAGFEIFDHGVVGDSAFAASRRPNSIDAPQRFGDGAYGRIDPGESGIRIDLPLVTAGLSTASQYWGPAGAHPLLLGNNAGGFVHAFAGTGTPVDLWVGRAHGRIVWGILEQSRYSWVQGREPRRFMSGLVAVFTPRWTPGLEVGAGRFFHSPWPGRNLSFDHLLKPLEGLLKENLDTGQPDNSDPDNQIASVFARWVFPGAGVEVYGEFGREDHSWDSRDLLLEPDHISAYMLGFRRVWARGPDELVALRGELINSQITHLEQTRGQSGFYVHSAMQQGHTHRGQILGSAAAYGGGGGLLAIDRYHEGGRWTVEASRLLRSELSPRTVGGVEQPSGVDVVYGLDAEALVFLRGLDLTARVSAAHNLNRNFADDRFNLGAAVGVRMRR
jgi:hypothetical protein